MHSPERLLASFFEAKQVKNYSPASLRSWRESSKTFCQWMALRGIKDIRSISEGDICAYQLWLFERKLSTSTVHIRIIFLRRFFEYLEETDIILFSPCRGLVLPKLENRLPKTILTETEVKKILDQPDTQTAVGIRDRALLELLYSTAMRRAEILALLIEDIDAKQGLLRVNLGKGRKDRVVPVGKEALEWARRYLNKPWAEWTKNQPDQRRLWLSNLPPHKPLLVTALYSILDKYRQRAEIRKRVTPHVFRHSCSTHLVSNGANLKAVQQLLGHSSLQTTQIYVRVVASELKKTVQEKHPHLARP
jgi:integrase/recombinase XerD